MEKCLFCNQDYLSDRIIVKNELAFAFPTYIPIVPWHILICPTRHVSSYDGLTPEEVLAIFDIAGRLKISMKKLFDAEWFNYAWNEWEIAWQSVPHFHLHMLPRKAGDTWIWEYEPRKFLYRTGSREKSPDSEIVAVAKQIKENL